MRASTRSRTLLAILLGGGLALARPASAQLTVQLNLQVTTVAGAPTVTWHPKGNFGPYTVERWKLDQPDCCRNTSPPVLGNSWTDAPLPQPGVYVYRVTVQSNGQTGYNDVQFTPPLASGKFGPRLDGASLVTAGAGAVGGTTPKGTRTGSGSAAGGAATAGGAAGAAGGGAAGGGTTSKGTQTGTGAGAGGAATAGGAAGGGAAGGGTTAKGTQTGSGAAAGGAAAAGGEVANPSRLTATQIGEGQVQLNWPPVFAASGYLLLGPGLPRGGVRVTGTITYTVMKVPGGLQRWQVGSLDAAGNSTPTTAFTTVDLKVGVP